MSDAKALIQQVRGLIEQWRKRAESADEYRVRCITHGNHIAAAASKDESTTYDICADELSSLLSQEGSEDGRPDTTIRREGGR